MGELSLTYSVLLALMVELIRARGGRTLDTEGKWAMAFRTMRGCKCWNFSVLSWLGLMVERIGWCL